MTDATPATGRRDPEAHRARPGGGGGGGGGRARELGERVRGAAGTVRHLATDRIADRVTPLVLELDLTAELVEVAPSDPVRALLERRRGGLADVLAGLRRAGRDPRVAVVVARVGPAGMSLARVQELRDAVSALRATGTRALAFADSFGEFGGGTVPYYLASAFDEIWLAPSGDLGLTGVALETPFLRDALDRLGVATEIGQRHEYKNAVNTFVERDFTPAHREASERLVASWAEQIVAGVAAGRSLPVERVRELIDSGPHSGAEALAAGLVDRLGYRDEVYAAARAIAAGNDAPAPAGEGGDGEGDDEEDGTRTVYLAHYQRAAARREAALRPPRPSWPRGSAPRSIAVIHAHGPVLLGRGQPVSFGPVMTSDAICAALRSARREKGIGAVVLRVDSPGGSYVASDLIRREVSRLRAAGTPVVVSMGAVAASGGYFVAMDADRIVAQPGTLTGSIGVFGGKQVLTGLLDKIGIGFGAVAEGEHALMLSPRRPFSPSERARLDDFLDRVYADFVAKVAAARAMTRDAVHEVARGRVWTGADAHERGLVDSLGGYERALEAAAELAGLPEPDPSRVRVLPRTSPLERLRPPRSSEDAAAGTTGIVGPLTLDPAAGWGALASAAARAGLPAAGPLLMRPPGWLG